MDAGKQSSKTLDHHPQAYLGIRVELEMEFASNGTDLSMVLYCSDTDDP